MVRGRFLLIAMAMLVVAGCQATGVNQQVTQLKHGSEHPRIVLMPVDVELFELTAGGLNEPKAEWTTSAQQYLVEAMRAENTKQNLAMVDYDEGAASEETRGALNQLSKLHGVVGLSIARHQYFDIDKLPSKQSKFDWTLGPSVRTLRDQFHADYALFTYVRDSYSSSGRVALQIVAAFAGVGVRGGSQVGFASLVDLETGDVVWFNRLARGNGDLRNQDSARETARTLLAGFPK